MKLRIRWRAILLGLAEPLSLWLDRELTRGSAVVFAGYGALDSFDVTPFFARPSGSFPRSTAVYFAHGNNPPSAAGPVPRILAPFGSCGWDGGETEDMLKSIPSASPSSARRPAPRAPALGWQEYFARAADLDAVETVRGMLALGLGQSLGVCTSAFYPSAFREALQHQREFCRDRCSRRWFHWRLGISYRAEGDPLRDAWHYLRGGASPEKPTEALVSWMNAHGIRIGIAAPPVEDLRASLQDAAAGSHPSDWHFSTGLSGRCEAMIGRAERSGAPAGSEERRLVDELTALLDEFIGREFAGVEFANQRAVALRKRALLSALRGEQPDSYLRQARVLYSDTTSIDGFIGSYRDMARALDIFNSVRGITNDAPGEWARRAVQAAEIVGSPRQETQSRRVLRRVSL